MKHPLPALVKTPLAQISATALVSCLAGQVSAQDILGWIHSDNQSAYTLQRNDFELSLGGIAVNDTIDILNIRDDLLSGTDRLIGNSGDLSGMTFEAHYGVFDQLSVFYQRQTHDLTLELGPISSANLVDVDTKLSTTSESLGFKWQFYEGGLLNPAGRKSAASFEVIGYRSQSDDFDVTIDSFTFSGVEVNFASPQNFSIADMEDDGWRARLTYSLPIFSNGIASVWAGFGKTNSQSSTTSDLTLPTFRNLFEQAFETEDRLISFGFSLNFMLTARIPLQISYEQLKLSETEFKREPLTPPAGIPSFLNASQVSADVNNILKARISYWLTPNLNVSLSGNLFENQFIGITPHYNNSLSGSFSDTPYGFAGVEIGYKFK